MITITLATLIILFLVFGILSATLGLAAGICSFLIALPFQILIGLAKLAFALRWLIVAVLLAGLVLAII